MRRALAPLALAAVCALAPPARAEDEAPEKQQARVLLNQGNALFEKGDLKGALVDFRAAYALYPSPKLLVNAAAAERELGDLPAAANDLRKFLDDTDADDPFLVDRARNELRALERRVGKLQLVGWPKRTQLEVDGKPARNPWYVAPGGHLARFVAPGVEAVERELDVGAGETVELPRLFASVLQNAAPPKPKPVEKKTRWWIPVTVIVCLAAATGGALAAYFLLSPSQQPLKSDLGTINFSMFH